MKKICIIFISLILIISFCISVYAELTVEEKLQIEPSDLGQKITSTYTLNPNFTYKIYIKVKSGSLNSYQIDSHAVNNNGEQVMWVFLFASSTTFSDNNHMGTYISVVSPNVTVSDTTSIYLPVYITGLYDIKPRYDADIWISTTASQDQLRQEAYNIGLQNGYNQGYSQGLSDYPGARDDWNLVQHMQHAIGFFIGDEYAQYVTPFAIAFTILMAYFIFIRWIFLFGKSQKALRVADIVVIVACICVMAVMYINMLTINIQNTNITESIESSSEVVRSFDPTNVYKHIDDTKFESVYKIVDDVRIGG